jgi:hypothetical protein
LRRGQGGDMHRGIPSGVDARSVRACAGRVLQISPPR